MKVVRQSHTLFKNIDDNLYYSGTMLKIMIIQSSVDKVVSLPKKATKWRLLQQLDEDWYK